MQASISRARSNSRMCERARGRATQESGFPRSGKLSTLLGEPAIGSDWRSQRTSRSDSSTAHAGPNLTPCPANISDVRDARTPRFQTNTSSATAADFRCCRCGFPARQRCATSTERAARTHAKPSRRAVGRGEELARGRCVDGPKGEDSPLECTKNIQKVRDLSPGEFGAPNDAAFGGLCCPSALSLPWVCPGADDRPAENRLIPSLQRHNLPLIPAILLDRFGVRSTTTGAEGRSGSHSTSKISFEGRPPGDRYRQFQHRLGSPPDRCSGQAIVSPGPRGEESEPGHGELALCMGFSLVNGKRQHLSGRK